MVALGLLIIFCGCASHIKPQSKFTIPELATSKIAGKLAIYAPLKIAQKVIKSEQQVVSPKHKALLIGKGVLQMTCKVVSQVFYEFEVFDRQPTEDYLKANGFRGLLQLDDIVAQLRLPSVDYNKPGELGKHDIGIRVNIVYSAIDFTAKQDARRTFGPDNEATKILKSGDNSNINLVIKNVTNRVLDDNAIYLAQMLINMYGAR
jgi:hypothetical protein